MISELLNSSFIQKLKAEKAILTLSIAASLLLIAKEYFGSAFQIYPLLEFFHADTLLRVFQYHPQAHFYKQLYWLFGCYLFYLLLPIVFVISNSQKMKEVGWKLTIPKQHIKIYLFLALIIIPVIIIAATTKRFQQTYPFFHFNPIVNTPKQFLIWEIGYMLQFVAVEFFFRGFLLFSFAKFIGSSAVYVSLIPYCMIHFGKPLPETIGAIVAGVVLGKMALESKSILPGIVIHCMVGCCMDCLSMYYKFG
jgi:membrane protease YdiL (CAAX protease family)